MTLRTPSVARPAIVAPLLLASFVFASACGGSSTTVTSATPTPSLSYEALARASDDHGYTARVLAAFQSAAPGLSFESPEPRTIDVHAPDGSGAQISLDRPWAYCVSHASECRDITDDFVSGMVEALERQPDEESTATRARLRVAVRNDAILRGYREGAGNQGMFSRPIGGDLHAVVMVDFPRTARVLFRDELAALELDEVGAFEVGLRQTLAELGPLGAETSSDCQALTVVADGNYYESTRLLDPAAFASRASAFGGELLVTVPAYDTLIFGYDCNPIATRTLALISRRAMGETSMPLSAQVFRLHAGQFEPVSR